MHLDQITDHIKSRLALDATLGALPFLIQVADETDEQDTVRAYNAALTSAMESPGVALVCIVADGELASSDSAPILDLDSVAVLSIVENTQKNTTGFSAKQLLRKALVVLHRGNSQAMGARTDTRLAKNAFQLGPLGGGKVIYFVNLLVRTSEPLGTLEPVTP